MLPRVLDHEQPAVLGLEPPADLPQRCVLRTWRLIMVSVIIAGEQKSAMCVPPPLPFPLLSYLLFMIVSSLQNHPSS